MNDTLHSIAKRYSCRAFTDVMPEPEKLEAIAKAAVQSPSGMNRQAWKVIVVRNRELIDEMENEAMRVIKGMEDKALYDRLMSRGGTVFYHTPCMIMVPIAPDTELDCGIVSENISLAATSLGMGSLICGLAGIAFSEEKKAYFEEKLGFPEGYKFGIAVLLGYEQNPGTPHEPDMGKISYID